MTYKPHYFLLYLLVIFAISKPVTAQWVTQSIPLHAGWNSVHVGVQPVDATFSTLFEGLPVEGIWQWDKRFSTHEFVLDPDTLMAPAPHWLVWFPKERDVGFLSALGRFRANHSYLIKMAADAPDCTIHVKGKATIATLDWHPNALNLVGFPIGQRAPTFGEWFEATDQVDLSRMYENEVYRVDASGKGQAIVVPLREKVEAGQAYWVKVSGALDYTGPIQVGTSISGGLDYDLSTKELGMTVRNLSTNRSYTLTITGQASEAPPAGEPELAGPVPLAYSTSDTADNGVLGWVNFDYATGVSKTLEPGGVWNIRWAVRRLQLADYVPQGDDGAAYQSVLNVTDSEQMMRIQVPVVADGKNAQRPGLAMPPWIATSPLEAHHDAEGLWVGNAAVTHVSLPSYEPEGLVPVRTPMTLRLMVHVDAQGNAVLLQRVYMAWVGGETNGMYRLYADESLIPGDAAEVRRMSSAAFPLMAPLAFTHAGGAGLTNQLSATLLLAHDDPTNPFFHRYHPMFDNKSGQFSVYDEAVESRAVERVMVLDIEADEEAVLDGEVTGTYSETFRGLRVQDIHASGPFLLRRVSRINSIERLAAP